MGRRVMQRPFYLFVRQQGATKKQKIPHETFCRRL